jgi:trigger factor
LEITSEDLGNRQVMLTIALDTDRVDRALRGAARRVSRDYNIPGFRRGRAPFQVVLQRFGREALLQEALDDLGQEAIQEALEREALDPYDVPKLEDIQLEPLVLKLRVPLRPKVDLGDYRELRVQPPEVTVEDTEVEEELERIRQANVILEPADGRPAQLDDWVSVDMRAEVNGEPFIEEEAQALVLDSRDDEWAEGLADEIVGLEEGEEKSFTLTLGDDWGEDKAGKEAIFNVKVLEVRNRILPDLDDDLARTVGDFDTLEELRESIREQFKADRQREADNAYTEEVLQALVDQAEIEYPPEMIEDQIDDMVEDLERRLEPQKIALEDYWKLTGQTEEQFRESLHPRAERTARRGLALGALATAEGLEVEGEEVNEQITRLTADWRESGEELRQALSAPESMRSIATSLLTDKVVQRLLAIARGEAPALEEAVQAEESVTGEPAPAEESGPADELAQTQPESGPVDESEGAGDIEEESLAQAE